VRDLQNQIGTTQAKIDQLQSTLDRLMGMYAEYQAQEKNDGKQLGLQNSMNQRQFMSQLLTLMQRVKTDIVYTENAIIGIKERLMLAERERIKMQTLADQNAQAVQREANKKDQRRMDALGVMQFNLKPHA